MTAFWKSIIAVIIVVNVFFIWFIFFGGSSPHIAYVDTGKLMIGFSDANNVDMQVKVEDDAWRAQLKVLQDMLSA